MADTKSLEDNSHLVIASLDISVWTKEDLAGPVKDRRKVNGHAPTQQERRKWKLFKRSRSS